MWEDAGHSGMGDSIAALCGKQCERCRMAGVAGRFATGAARHAAVHGAGAARSTAVVAWPEFAGERGHPVAFERDCLPDLLALQGEKGVAPVVRKWAEQGWGRAVPVQDQGVVTDIDTVEALARAEALWHQRQAAG